MNDVHIFTLSVILIVGNSDQVISIVSTIQIQSGKHQVLVVSVGIQNMFVGKIFFKKNLCHYALHNSKT